MRGAVLFFLALLGAAAVADRQGVQRDVRTERFATAIVCQTCHANADDSGAMRDHQGRGVAPHDLWRSSMMANSARDPFYRAAVAAEAAAAPQDAQAIEARCLHCHAPMASVEAHAAGKPGLTLAQLDEEFEEDDADRAALARDGVSCTLCHKIEPGAKPDGGFTIGDDRDIFGPFDEQFGLAMHRVTKYWPVPGTHILRSEHCATCHTAKNETATFLEWRNSAFREETTCQDCHMPGATDGKPIRTRIARTSHGGDIRTLPPREPVGRHLFVGGNTLVPRILRDNADALHVKAPPEAFDATIAAARELLTERTARVSIEEAAREGDEVYIVIRVQNLCGHKFPTGHVSRRAWLRMRVRDSQNRIVFASGATDAQGRLPGAGEAAGGPVPPHLMEISKPDQVQIYEAVLKGNRTLSHNTKGFLKDNRLLPQGWNPKHEDAGATQPVGTNDDEDFRPGEDTVVYKVPFPEDDPTFIVEIALLYQPLSPRYAAELFKTKHPEVARFRKFYEAAGNPPEVIARDRLVVAPQ